VGVDFEGFNDREQRSQLPCTVCAKAWFCVHSRGFNFVLHFRYNSCKTFVKW